MHKLLEMGEPSELQLLRQRVEELEGELENSRDALEREKKKSIVAIRAMGTLRGILQPLYNGLKAIYGELDAAGAQGMQPSDSQADGKWEIWKRKLPGKTAEIIQALLDHGEMTVKQMMAATHTGQNTVYGITAKLGELKLLNKNGGKFSLREL